jgi:hypothetical protein
MSALTWPPPLVTVVVVARSTCWRRLFDVWSNDSWRGSDPLPLVVASLTIPAYSCISADAVKPVSANRLMSISLIERLVASLKLPVAASRRTRPADSVGIVPASIAAAMSPMSCCAYPFSIASSSSNAALPLGPIRAAMPASSRCCAVSSCSCFAAAAGSFVSANCTSVSESAVIVEGVALVAVASALALAGGPEAVAEGPGGTDEQPPRSVITAAVAKFLITITAPQTDFGWADDTPSRPHGRDGKSVADTAPEVSSLPLLTRGSVNSAAPHGEVSCPAALTSRR